MHGDVRADNILVAEQGNVVWIIDFEFAEIVNEADDASRSCLSNGVEEVKNLLMGFTYRGDSSNHRCENGSRRGVVR
jgi:aminoglycoside phosphotransferase (APT) family kinase protein